MTEWETQRAKQQLRLLQETNMDTNLADRKSCYFTLVKSLLANWAVFSLGASFLIIFLPILVYTFAFFLNDVSGLPPPSLLHPSSFTIDALASQVGWPDEGISGLFDARVAQYVLGYYALHAVMQMVLPGKVVEGVVLGCGGRHVYKINGMSGSLHYMKYFLTCISFNSLFVCRFDFRRMRCGHIRLWPRIPSMDLSLG